MEEEFISKIAKNKDEKMAPLSIIAAARRKRVQMTSMKEKE